MRRGTKIGLLLGIPATLALGGVLVASCFSLEKDPNELAVGAPAPETKAELLDTSGAPFSLATVNPGGLRVLVFYRGAW